MFHLHEGRLVAESMQDLTIGGWRVLVSEEFKPGATRVHAVRGGAGTLRPEFATIYVGTPQEDPCPSSASSS
ncbi:MAG: hypothetical protein BWY85_00015 [Firmicutes bacterium ADurb.Bin506]|nr:MAG: hypothetical protein BWY85_00015 [Firmicutes bacterium ADurb.Bin506]